MYSSQRITDWSNAVVDTVLWGIIGTVVCVLLEPFTVWVFGQVIGAV